MTRVSNRQIVEELKEGDQRGCSHLVELYQARLSSEAVRVFYVPPLDAEELASDVLLTVVERIQAFEFKRSDSDFHAWVMTIFRNRAKDYLRHQARSDGLPDRYQEEALEDEAAYTVTEREVVRSIIRSYEEAVRLSSEDDHRNSDRLRNKLHTIAQTLDEMETWERVLLRCRALDVPFEEIAHYTGKTVQQLKVYHVRVKKKFVKLLARHYPELAGS